jgi:putative ABC transport system permease protein
MYVGRYYGYVIQMTPNDLNLIKGLLIIVLLVLTQSRKLNMAAIKAMVQK